KASPPNSVDSRKLALSNWSSQQVFREVNMVRVSQALKLAVLRKRADGVRQYTIARRADLHPTVLSNILNEAVPIHPYDARVLAHQEGRAVVADTRGRVISNLATRSTESVANDRLTEAGVAERFVRLHGDDVRYVHPRGQWLVWHEHRWLRDEDEGVMRLALD